MEKWRHIDILHVQVVANHIVRAILVNDIYKTEQENNCDPRFQQHWLEGRESSGRDTVSSTRGHEGLRDLAGSIFNVEVSENEKWILCHHLQTFWLPYRIPKTYLPKTSRCRTAG